MNSGTEPSDYRNLSHAELRGAPPPGRALSWVCSVFGSGATIVSVHRLHGGHDHAVHGIVVATRAGAEQRAVLRRWVRPGWELTDPDCTVDREALALSTLAGTAVPAPEVVATDADARHCDVPALLMSWLPGVAAAPQPQDMEGFLRQLAEALWRLHECEPPPDLPAYRPYNDLQNPAPPIHARRPDIWEKAFAAVAAGPPPVATRLIHRDYHPGNTLWAERRLTGIVDWLNASRGPAGVDLSHMRWNLVLAFGAHAAETFVHAYRTTTQADREYHPYWDLRTVVDLCPEPAAGPLSADEAQRLERYMERALAAL